MASSPATDRYETLDDTLMAREDAVRYHFLITPLIKQLEP